MSEGPGKERDGKCLKVKMSKDEEWEMSGGENVQGRRGMGMSGGENDRGRREVGNVWNMKCPRKREGWEVSYVKMFGKKWDGKCLEVKMQIDEGWEMSGGENVNR